MENFDDYFGGLSEEEYVEETKKHFDLLENSRLKKENSDLKEEIKRLKFTIEGDRTRHQSKLSDRRYACGVLWDSLEKETEENRKLHAELDQLVKEHHDLISEKDLLFDVSERQRNEIENLNIELQAMRGAANSYKLAMKKLISGLDVNAVHTIKVDVLNDFVEKFKQKYFFADETDIKNLVKEMVEGD